MCCGCGPGSATTLAPATCTPAPEQWSSGTAGCFLAPKLNSRRCQASGAYTAAAIAAIAFDRPASPVDGNIERVVSRLFAVEDELPGAKPIIRRLAQSLTPPQSAGDFAQAMMDLGATICTPKSPACVMCPWTSACVARAAGTQETFPRKAPKTTGKLRRGAIFVALRAVQSCAPALAA